MVSADGVDGAITAEANVLYKQLEEKEFIATEKQNRKSQY